jgi:hypothetical protein
MEYEGLVAVPDVPVKLGSDAAAEARKIADGIRARYAQDPRSLTISDAILYEKMLVRLLPEGALRRKASHLRDRFRRLVEPEEYQLYLESGPPDPLNGNVDDLRTDLDALLDRIHYLYNVSPFREEMRSRLSSRISALLLVLLAPVAVTATVLALVNASRSHATVSALLPVAAAGAIGGFVSVQQRIQSAPSEGDAIRGVLALYDGWFSVYLSPLTGAIFATVLYLLFAGGLVKGAAFPDLSDAAGAAGVSGFRSFLVKIEPRDATDYAKLLIWAFIAGFAERLVPDTLNRLVAAIQSGSEAKPPALVVARGSGQGEGASAPNGSPPGAEGGGPKGPGVDPKGLS